MYGGQKLSLQSKVIDFLAKNYSINLLSIFSSKLKFVQGMETRTLIKVRIELFFSNF